MSLQVYMYRRQVPKDREIAYDVEVLFGSIPLVLDEYTLKAFKAIDGGEVVKDFWAISGLTGTTMSVYDMSTGCKAACCVPKTDKVVSLQEVGLNARDFILTNCRSGAVVLDKEHGHIGTEFDDVDVPEVDVMLGNHHITSVEELNYMLDGEVFMHEDFFKPSD